MVKAKNKLEALSTNEEVGDIVTHWMKSGSAFRPSGDLLELNEFGKKLLPKTHRGLAFEYDIWFNTNENYTIRKWLYTDFMGKGLYFRVPSIKINNRLFKSIVNSDIKIDEERISLLMGKNCHVVIYPLNKNKDLNFVCIIRDKNYDPDNVTALVKRVVTQNSDLEKAFKGELQSWPLYFTPQILPSTNNKVFYIGDAFNGFLPTLAQGAGQSIESANELFNLINEDKENIQNAYYQKRSKIADIVRRRSNINFLAFHFSSSIMQVIRNLFIKFLVKRKKFISSYLGKVYNR